MRKFTIQSKKGKTAIMEVECEIIQAIEDPSVLWSLNPGEYRARILAPESTFQKVKQKDEAGKEVFVMVPDIWCWHALYDSKEEAEAAAVQAIRNGFAFDERKYDKAYTEEDVQAAIAAIEVVALKA